MLTPIHLASKNGFCHVAKLLIQHGCNVNATDNVGRTALHHAVTSNDSEMVELIIENVSYICGDYCILYLKQASNIS